MSDNELLVALRGNQGARNVAWEYMYRQWHRLWTQVILKSGGTPEEADDAFCDVYEDFHKAVIRPAFELRHTLRAYLVRCVINAWSKAKGRTVVFDALEDKHLEGEAPAIDVHIFSIELKSALNALFAAMSERCRVLLEMYFEEYEMTEIAQRMGYERGAETAKKEAYKCRVQMLDYLKTNAALLDRLKKMRYE